MLSGRARWPAQGFCHCGSDRRSLHPHDRVRCGSRDRSDRAERRVGELHDTTRIDRILRAPSRRIEFRDECWRGALLSGRARWPAQWARRDVLLISTKPTDRPGSVIGLRDPGSLASSCEPANWGLGRIAGIAVTCVSAVSRLRSTLQQPLSLIGGREASGIVPGPVPTE